MLANHGGGADRRSLREGGVTILMVEHIMEVLMPIADRVVVREAYLGQ
jgi:ABC-type branched-subunit amino acid transport system ATPase component